MTSSTRTRPTRARRHDAHRGHATSPQAPPTADGPVTAMGVLRRLSAASLVLAAPPKRRLADLPRHLATRAELLVRGGGDVPILIFHELIRQTSNTYPVTTDDNGLVATESAHSSKLVHSLPTLVDRAVRGRSER